mmetsp:Transcript_20458/g.29291  ORF Transcript_20458/g.29291 Transcript_20458/m.29291 type:complete len:333 (+) Transcript_20458:38-1036(+)|eukprot:CAMPEP_0201697368 /NCGR_PEP_ID=MMETSP0578-20130828/10990_1 /ASSEMBLY_ACC=CAM_ASM_000663 /TAXON_ID=267565 /ORGANISM="Skeletonema grethea, Strain CCMP 1804" /LENGTH=332 /DNA_ID=CAMNT_0048183531 /DNA_START=29 /DNA_END=1024 /DNA_ORIENTATION=+
MATDPLLARHYNTLGISCHGQDDAEALQYHQDALKILDWNKCNALLFEKHVLYKDYALEMAVTLSYIGDVMRRVNDFIGAAKAYKECLDLFLEGLIDNGITLKTRLNEIEQQPGYAGGSYGASMDDVDFISVGKTLHEHSEYARIVDGINTLLREIQCAKFVSHSASSRRRRRMSEIRKTEANLKKAVESLSTGSETAPILKSQARPSLKRSISVPAVELKRPSMIRRSVTSIDDDQDKYVGISSWIAPAEKALVIALKRFPAPKTVPDVPSHAKTWDATPASGERVKSPPRHPWFAEADPDSRSPRSVERIDSRPAFDVPAYVHVELPAFL